MTVAPVKALAFAATALLVLTSCASSRTTAYPSSWPALREDVTCASLSGTFANRADASTYWEFQRANAPPFFLSDLLTKGMTFSWNAPARIQLFGSPTGPHVVLQEPTSQSQLAATIDGQWSCEVAEPPTLVMRSDAAGEGAGAGVRETRLQLHLRADGALVVHWMQKSHGIGFALLPYKDAEEDWFSFAVAP